VGSTSEVKVLLDTHTWLWYLLGHHQLSKRHRKIIEDESTELSLSSISIWEVHLLIEKNRLPVNEPPAIWIKNALGMLQVREAGITFAIALRSRSLALNNQDPADRFIAATAIEMKVPLLTADERLLACPDIRCF
jgi:PIN domain nuclease of toxin-antitoxin system